MSLAVLQPEIVEVTPDQMDGTGLSDDQAATVRKMVADVAALHRSDGYVAFMQNPPSGAMRLGAPIRVSELTSIFPEFAADYLSDGYVGVNSILPDARWRGTAELPPMLQPWDWRRKQAAQRNEHVEWLNACFCDVDCDDLKPPVPVSVVEQAMNRLVRDGVVPAPTGKQYSGGGVWFYWYLYDPACPTSSHRVRSQQDRITYRAVNELLGKALDKFGRDAQAVHPMQWTGLSETRKTKYGGAKVKWEHCPGGRCIRLRSWRRGLATRPLNWWWCNVSP